MAGMQGKREEGLRGGGGKEKFLKRGLLLLQLDYFNAGGGNRWTKRGAAVFFFFGTVGIIHLSHLLCFSGYLLTPVQHDSSVLQPWKKG